MWAGLLISGGVWLWLASTAGGLVLLTLVWSYRRAPTEGATAAVGMGLKVLGTLVLGACLVEPLWTGQRARPGANLFVILADNSQSLRIKDPGAKADRGSLLRALLTDPAAAWPAKLEENFQVRRYAFEARLQSLDDFAALDFSGRASALATALQSVAQRYQDQPLAGVLLLTDGNATDLPAGRLDARGLPPIYPVVLGNEGSLRDVALERVAVSQTAFEDAPVSLQADVASAGYAGQTLVAQLRDQSGRLVQEQRQRQSRAEDLVPFRFEFKPDQPGLSFYQLRVGAQAEWAEFDQPQTTPEATLANNQRVVVVDRGRGPYRVLYVGGRPNWEFKFMNRALEKDDQLRLVALIRIAKREGKFEFRGRPGESSNPLFRGFGNQQREEIEGYDEAVLRRLNTRDALELAGGFPKSAEELDAYHAVVLDHLEAGFFTGDQMLLLQRFVSERGGGLLMLGGAESFREGDYDRTPVGDLLPVYLDHVSPPAGPLTNLVFALTHEGWLQPWARLRRTEAEERRRLEAMPPFMVLNRVRGVKPGASTIATVHDDRGHEYPALVTQRFGRGRVGALLLGDLWRWGFRDAALHQDMDKAWRQLSRWLVADVPERIDLQAHAIPGDPNQAVRLQARVRDKTFQPLDNATVRFSVRTLTTAAPAAGGVTNTALNASSAPISLTAEPSATEAGLYEAAYIPRQTGGYMADAVATDANGAQIGRAETGWTADPAAEEFRRLRPNRALLEQLARETGGQVIAASQLEAFARNLPNRRAPITERWSQPLWHRPAVFLLALGCLIGEWGVRRWRGLA